MRDIKYKLIQMVWYNADKHVFLNKDRDWTLMHPDYLLKVI